MNAKTALVGVPETEGSTTRWPPTVLGVALLSAFTLLWLPSLRSSLWLDEMGTFWVIKDGWTDALHRGYEYHGQPVYYLIAWIARHLFGTSELGLRLPSLFAMVGVAYLVSRIGRRLWDGRTGLLAAVVFVSSANIAFVAADARPYAVLYLAAAGATLLFIRYFDDGKRRDAVCYVLLAALMLHLQLLAFPVLLAHAVYGLRRASLPAVSSRSRTLIVSAIAVAMVTLIPSFLWFTARRGLFSFAGPPRLDVLARFVLLPLIIAGAAVLMRRGNDDGPAWRPASRRPWLIALSLLLFPPGILFIVSSFSSSLRVFFPRYFGVATIGVALVVAMAFRRLQPPALAVALAVVFSVASVTAAGIATSHFDTDWRAAASFERSHADAGTPLLVNAGFVEALDVGWLVDDEDSDYLLSPLAYYRFEGIARPLPLILDERSHAYLERLTRTALSGASEFIVIENAPDFLTAWFADRMRGLRLKDFRRFGSVSVAYFSA